MKDQQGFTLIELVLVIVILGILAAVAVPRFINLSSEAQKASLQSTVGSIESASAINFAAYQVSPVSAVPVAGGTACSTLFDGVAGQSFLQQPLDTSKFKVSGNIASSAAPGTSVTSCVLQYVGTNYSARPTILVTN